MAPFPPRLDAGGYRIQQSVKRRILTALLVAPPALLLVVLGPPWSDLLLLLLAGVMASEWARICSSGRAWSLPEVTLIFTAPSALLFAMVAGLGGAAVGLLAAQVLLLLAQRASLHRDAALPWLSLGLYYVALPLMLLHWLRGDAAAGRDLVLWLLLVVWVFDSAAYLFGRTLGGPKLAPRWSPSKTWSGLLGGIFSAMLAGWVGAFLLSLAAPNLMALLAGLLALVGQGGDLAESALKRRFGVKDASQLLPGHGGLLDRVDGLVAAIIPVAALAALGALAI